MLNFSNLSIDRLSISSVPGGLNDEANSDAPRLSLVDHEILLKREGVISSHQNSVVITLKHLDEGYAKCNFLIKFSEIGAFSLKLMAEYIVTKQEIYDDAASMIHNGGLTIEAKKPFEIKHE